MKSKQKQRPSDLRQMHLFFDPHFNLTDQRFYLTDDLSRLFMKGRSMRFKQTKKMRARLYLLHQSKHIEYRIVLNIADTVVCALSGVTYLHMFSPRARICTGSTY